MTTTTVDPRVKYRREVERAARARSPRRFLKLGEFGNENSAYTIAWMVRHGRGLFAFEAYPPGTFEAVTRNGNEVWFRRA